MKVQRISLAFAIVAAACIQGCSSSGPTNADVSQIQAEMKAQVPKDSQPIPADEAAKGVQMMGKKGGGGAPASGPPNFAPTNAPNPGKQAN